MKGHIHKRNSQTWVSSQVKSGVRWGGDIRCQVESDGGGGGGGGIYLLCGTSGGVVNLPDHTGIKHA